MNLCAILLVLSMGGAPVAAVPPPAVAGSGSDGRRDDAAATRELLVTAGNIAAILGGALGGMGITLLGTYGLVFYEEVRVGLTTELAGDSSRTPVVTDPAAYQRKMAEGQALWSGGWLSLSAGLGLMLVGAGISMTPQLFMTPAEE